MSDWEIERAENYEDWRALSLPYDLVQFTENAPDLEQYLSGLTHIPHDLEQYLRKQYGLPE